MREKKYIEKEEMRNNGEIREKKDIEKERGNREERESEK